MDQQEKLVLLDLVEVVLAVRVLPGRQRLELVLEELRADLVHVLDFLREEVHEVRVDYREHQVHNEKHAQQQIGAEEDEVDPLLLVRWQHDVRVIGGRHQHHHVEEGVAEVIHVLHALQRAGVEVLPHAAEVKDEDEEEHDHRHRDVDDPQVTGREIAQHSELSDHVEWPDEGGDPRVSVGGERLDQDIDNCDHREDDLTIPAPSTIFVKLPVLIT